MKPRQVGPLVCWVTGIEVRVLLQCDTCMALETAKVPNYFWKARVVTKYFWYTDEIVEDNRLYFVLTAYDDSIRITCRCKRRLEENEVDGY